MELIQATLVFPSNGTDGIAIETEQSAVCLCPLGKGGACVS